MQRLWEYLNEHYPENVIRAKGLFWLASRPDDAINFSQAGGSSRLEKAGVWWCSMPFSERLNYASFVQNRDYIESRWNKKWGDRLNEIVFIGQNLDENLMKEQLNSCLLQENEFDLINQKNHFFDPFPVQI